MTEIQKILQFKKASIYQQSPHTFFSERLSKSLSAGYLEYIRKQNLEIMIHSIICFSNIHKVK